MASQSLRPLGLLIHIVAFLLVCAFCLPGGVVLVELIRFRKSFAFPTPIELELVCAAAVVLALGLASRWMIARVLGWALVFLGYAAMGNALTPDRPAEQQLIWLGVGAGLGLIAGLVAGRRRGIRAAPASLPADGSEVAQSASEERTPATFQPGWAAVLAGGLLVAATAVLVVRYELRIATQTAIAEAVASTGGRTIYDHPGTPSLLFPWLDLLLPHGDESLCLRSVELGPRAGDEDLARLASLGLGRLPHLRELRMRESRVTDAALAIVAPLTDLERISLGKATTDAGIARLGVQPALRMLDLSRTQITGEALNAIGQFPALACLHLQNTNITNEDLARLKVSRELLTLDLSATSITDDGLVHLTDLPNLSSLLLIETPVTDEGLKHLARFPQLKWLFLAGSRVTPQGRAEFHRACPTVWTD